MTLINKYLYRKSYIVLPTRQIMQTDVIVDV